MPRGRGGRRLATVLFLDIVGSTSVASEMGDARWHGLLSRFGNVVRGRLKAEGGREESFTGDGFLATFAEPAYAVRAAEGIVEDVRLLGIEVRAGVHTGEIETIDGHDPTRACDEVGEDRAFLRSGDRQRIPACLRDLERSENEETHRRRLMLVTDPS